MREKNKTLVTPEGYTVSFRERESVEIKLNIPKEVLETLEKIAKKKELSVESVLKFFIGKGLRDLEPEMAKKLSMQRLKSRKSKEEKLEIDLAA
ncbi:MAG TPA: hypothetical protein PKE69_03540 [Pyrinomonadaceae bacterium]|nr:hypothetical protein [Pyrinomonadaceae bacterium]